MGRRGYPPEFRRRVLDLVEGGRTVTEVANDLEVSEQTIYGWRRQARIDAESVRWNFRVGGHHPTNAVLAPRLSP